MARDLKRAGKLGQVTKKIKLADLILKAGVAAGRDKVSVEYIGDILKKLDCWPISKIKTALKGFPVRVFLCPPMRDRAHTCALTQEGT